MPNELPLPAELMHLIEKRSGTDRRKTPADATEDPAKLSTPAIETDQAASAAKERRSKKNRRSK